MATARIAQQSTTLTALRRRVAARFGDHAQLIATATGTTTTLIDTLNVSAAAENFNGRILLFAEGTAANIGKQARVSTTTDSSSTVAFIPAASANTAAGDVVDVFNRRGIGFAPNEYTNAINAAIDDAFPLGVIDIQSEFDDFDADEPDLMVPVNMIDVYDLEWQDPAGLWHRVLKATRSNAYGWRVNAPAGTIVFSGAPAWQANASTLRISGYGRQDSLTDEADVCLLNAEYVVSRACYHLAAGALMRDSAYAQLTPMFQQESEKKRLRLRTLSEPSRARVRSV